MKNVLALFLLSFAGLSFACGKNDICSNDRVMHNLNGETAYVVEVFPQGKVMIDWDNAGWSNSVVTMAEISKKSRCAEGMCNTDRVFHMSQKVTASVKEVFQNGKLIIDWEKSGWGDSVVTRRELARIYRCMGNLCKGDRVLHEAYDIPASVVEVYENGMVKIDWDKSGWADSVVGIEKLGFEKGEGHN